MVISMDASLAILWFTTGNWRLCMGVGIAMILCAVWAWRYPGTMDEYQRRLTRQERIGWFG